MTPAETARVLAAAAAFDRRTVGQADVAAWHSALYELDYPDARDAVTRHYQISTEWIMPMHILRTVQARREAARLRDMPPVAEQPAAGAHPFVGAGLDCETCGLPRQNRRHPAA